MKKQPQSACEVARGLGEDYYYRNEEFFPGYIFVQTFGSGGGDFSVFRQHKGKWSAAKPPSGLADASGQVWEMPPGTRKVSCRTRRER